MIYREEKSSGDARERERKDKMSDIRTRGNGGYTGT